MWSRTADSFLAASHALAKSLPLTLSALQSGTISWQHALVMVDETATLDSAGAAALERHFLDPDAPKPATAAPVGDLPAHQASAAWNRLTAAARGLQGPAEARTLTQLRADLCGDWLFGACLQPPAGTGPFRRQWHASSPPMAPAPSTGCWWTRGTGLHWKSAAPATGSPRPCGPLDNEADHILAWGNGGTTGYRTWGSRAQSTTDSGIPVAGNPPRPPKTNHQAGLHRAAATTGAEHQDWEPPHWPRQSRPVTSDSGPVTGNVPAAAGPIPPRAPALPQSPLRRFRPGAGRSGQTWP